MRGAAVPGRARPPSRARAPVAHPGAAGWRRVPAAATPGPERRSAQRRRAGPGDAAALHAPRRAPRQPGVRAAAAARAEPRPGPRPAPGGSMSQAELSTCSAPQTQRIFQEAVRKGNTQELQSLLQNMTNCEFNVNSFGPEGQTALHQSVIDGNLELVKLLVKFGADIRLANRDGWSALHIAAFGGHQDIVLYLITKAKYAASGR
ncbi:PREDICTED: notch-regulated ankyrin repeat-containing protein [Cercocebus atys]|nr:PREDICTED: notch-regulated ankyrin repeat-containing protein [Cercocebus atys]